MSSCCWILGLELRLFVLVLLTIVSSSPVRDGMLVSDNMSDQLFAQMNRQNGLSLKPSPIKSDKNQLHLIQFPKFDPTAQKQPKKKHLDQTELLGQMGEDYNTQYMSIDKPLPDKMEPQIVYNLNSSESNWLRDDVDRLNLSDELSSMLSNGNEDSLTPEVLRAFSDYLIKRSSCPIKQEWKDLGILFWPRWIRQGECLSESEYSCSIPTGMKCKPAGSITINILRWHCRPHPGANPADIFMRRLGRGAGRKGKGRKKARKQQLMADEGVTERIEDLQGRRRRKSGHHHLDNGRHYRIPTRCSWLKVPYPLSVSCTCSC